MDEITETPGPRLCRLGLQPVGLKARAPQHHSVVCAHTSLAWSPRLPSEVRGGAPGPAQSMPSSPVIGLHPRMEGEGPTLAVQGSAKPGTGSSASSRARPARLTSHRSLSLPAVPGQCPCPPPSPARGAMCHGASLASAAKLWLASEHQGPVSHGLCKASFVSWLHTCIHVFVLKSSSSGSVPNYLKQGLIVLLTKAL